jgi:hypothetical protein
MKIVLRSFMEIKDSLMDRQRAGFQVMIFSLSHFNSSVSLTFSRNISSHDHLFIKFFLSTNSTVC